MMIYLDNSATTKMCDEALSAFVNTARTDFGNPSSRHAVGDAARRILQASRETLLRALGEKDGTVIFTGSGSEADNLAILGRAAAKERYRRGAKILTTAGEHAAVKEPLRRLEAKGFRIAVIPTKNGELDREFIEREMTPDVILVSAMAVNNETGAVYDLPYLSRVMKAKSPEAVLHIDATQAFMQMPFSVRATGASMVTVSAHKIEGPKGVGALYIDKELLKTRGLAPHILGGGQEGGLRSGTENLPGIASFAAAVEYRKKNLASFFEKTDGLRRYLLMRLSHDARLAEVRPILPSVASPHILPLILPDIKSETALNFLSAKGICVSSGSACSSHGKHLSGAYLSFGLSEREADTTIRVSLSHTNEKEELDTFLSVLAEAVSTLARIR